VSQVVTNLTLALRERDVNLTWLACGTTVQEAAQWCARPELKDSGQFLGPLLTDQRERAAAYLEFIINHNPSAVLFHVFCGQVESNLVAYLPKDILRIGMVHTITPATYRAARGMRDYLHAVIGVSPRISEDLVRLCRFPPDIVSCAPNGVDSRRFAAQERDDKDGRPLRVLRCGRIEDMAKGVFWIPAIVAKSRALGVDVALTIAGDGPDRAELERRVQCSGLQAHTDFRGWVSREELPRVYAEHDVFLFPSRFEGLGLALVEAMAAGCVPVATRIRGVTDFVVKDGQTGFLFPPGDVGAAAHLLNRLGNNRKQLIAMRQACRENSFDRFDVREQARTVADSLARTVAEPRRVKDPLPIAQWNIMPSLRPAWWRRLPEPVKNHLRVIRERVGAV